MKKQQSGFTLIELVVVIVILGILAATALPKYIDLKGSAEQAAADGLAGAIGSSAAIQYAGSQVNSATFAYSSVSACAGGYLTSGLPGTCSTSGSTSCSITCGSGSASVTLP